MSVTSTGDHPTSGIGEQLVQLARRVEPLVELADPSSESAIREAESQLGVRLPVELRAFLLQSDGATIAVRLSSGDLVQEASPLVWSVAEILSENRDFPSRGYHGAERVLFFANAGVDGVLFGHALEDTGLRDEVVVWHPIERQIEAFAPSFSRYLEGWLNGELSV